MKARAAFYRLTGVIIIFQIGEFMTANNKINWKRLILALVVSIGAGVISWLLTGNSMEMYKNLNKPPLSPPGQLFPIVWTILFVLMGIASYIVCETRDDDRTEALILYGVQLFVNIGWSVIFFNFGTLWLAFFWLMLLWVLIIFTISRFYQVNTAAAWLMVPYLLWVTFAAYLNIAIAIMN